MSRGLSLVRAHTQRVVFLCSLAAGLGRWWTHVSLLTDLGEGVSAGEECVCVCVCVCRVFNSLYALIKPWLPAHTQSKIRILGSDYAVCVSAPHRARAACSGGGARHAHTRTCTCTHVHSLQEVLLRDIDASVLPSFLGGQVCLCVCVCACV